MRLLAGLPAPFVADVTAWVQVLRGQASRPSHPTAWSTVYAYLTNVRPVLQQWAIRVDSLRAITRDDINAAIRDHPGRSAHNLHTSLRSLFRALRRERRVFTDPARGVPGGYARRLARPLPSDRLDGLLDRAQTDLAKLAVALVAVHALHTEELRRTQMEDVDRSRGRLAIHRRGAPHHVVFLDELCLTLLDRWLRERARRWPTGTNPYLVVTAQTALDPRHPPISQYGINRLFTPLGVTPSQLRIDRILNEAHHSEDPIRLMRIFGLAKTTAIRYIATVQPERISSDPQYHESSEP
jgi:integrase